jgi:mono/diheme cytochrome c family protein
MNRLGLISFVMFAASVALGSAVTAADRAVEPSSQAAVDFVATHCAACHGETKPRGGIRLDTLQGELSKERDSWENVRRVLIDKEMPPRNRKQPTSDEVQGVLKWIDADSTRSAKRTPPRRLNRFEFNHSLNALLGIDEDFVPFLPEDAKVNGFDTDAKALSMTGPAMAEYVRTAILAVQYAMQGARPGEGKTYRLVDVIKAAKFRTVLPDNLQEKSQQIKDDSYIFLRGDGVVLRPRFMSWQNAMKLAIPLPDAFAADGADRMRLTVRVQSTVPDGRSSPWLIVRINGQPLGQVLVPASSEPKEYSFVFRKSHLDRQIGAVLKELVLEVMCGYEPTNGFSDQFKRERDAIFGELRKKDAKPSEATVKEHVIKHLDSYPTLTLDVATLTPATYPASANAHRGSRIETTENGIQPALRRGRIWE